MDLIGFQPPKLVFSFQINLRSLVFFFMFFVLLFFFFLGFDYECECLNMFSFQYVKVILNQLN